MTQAVWKLFFGDRDEISNHEIGLCRNNDTSTLPSGFNCCAEGLDIGVFTQPGPTRNFQSTKRFQQVGTGIQAFPHPYKDSLEAQVL